MAMSSSKPGVKYAPFDVRLPVNDEKDEDIQTVVQPDILVICDKSKLDRRVYRGAPALVSSFLTLSVLIPPIVLEAISLSRPIHY